jgi:hypothetical protein
LKKACDERCRCRPIKAMVMIENSHLHLELCGSENLLDCHQIELKSKR